MNSQSKPSTPKGQQPKPRQAGANAPVSWGGLYLLFVSLGNQEAADYCLDQIIALDS